jgi:hypothetical protein
MNDQFELLPEQLSKVFAGEARLDDKRVQLYLLEYTEHLHNIRDRVQIEQSILNYTVVLMAALIPASIQIVDHRAFAAFFFVPFIFTALAILVLRQDLMITAIARYVYTCLCPRLRMIIHDDQAFRLEETLFKLRTSKTYVPVGIARYALFGIPSVVALFAVPYLKYKFHFLWLRSDSFLAASDILLIFVTALWIARASSSNYLKLTKK